MATPVDVKEPPTRHSESRGITTAAMLLLAAGVGLFVLESCTQAPEGKTKEPVVTKDAKDAKAPEVKAPEVKAPEEPKAPEVKPPDEPKAMPPPAT
jgi:hypothetical protein